MYVEITDQGIGSCSRSRSVIFLVRSTNCFRWELFRAEHRGGKLLGDGTMAVQLQRGRFPRLRLPSSTLLRAGLFAPGGCARTAFSVSSAEVQERQEQEITASVMRNQGERRTTSQ
jgi:hypothetical protein